MYGYNISAIVQDLIEPLITQEFDLTCMLLITDLQSAMSAMQESNRNSRRSSQIQPTPSTSGGC